MARSQPISRTERRRAARRDGAKREVAQRSCDGRVDDSALLYFMTHRCSNRQAEMHEFQPLCGLRGGAKRGGLAAGTLPGRGKDGIMGAEVKSAGSGRRARRKEFLHDGNDLRIGRKAVGGAGYRAGARREHAGQGVPQGRRLCGDMGGGASGDAGQPGGDRRALEDLAAGHAAHAAGKHPAQGHRPVARPVSVRQDDFERAAGGQRDLRHRCRARGRVASSAASIRWRDAKSPSGGCGFRP